MSTSKIVQFVALVLSALSSGVFFGTRTGLGPSTRRFTPGTYVELQQATVRNLRPVMGPLLPAAVLANAALLAVRPRAGHRPEFALTLTGLALQLTSLGLTAVVELPINAQVLEWSAASPPAGWEATRDRWAVVHTLRTVTSVAGFASVTASTLLDGAPAV